MTGIKLDASPIVRALAKENVRRWEALLGTARALAERMEAHAKANRP